MFKALGIILVVVIGSVEPFQNQVNFPLSVFNLNSTEKLLKDFKFLDIGEQCLDDLNKWREAFFNMQQELWAFQMFDSISKSIDGLAIGRFKTPGHFDECVRVRTDTFQGQHCMVPFDMEPNSFISSYSGNKEVIPNNFFFAIGICLPSTCNISDINNALMFLRESGIVKASNVTARDCSIDELPPLRTEDWVTVALIIFIVLTAIASTYYEYKQIFVYKNDKPNQLLTSFSLYKNSKLLFQISQSSSQLKCLHGIRFFSMTWVILGHAYITFMWGAPMNLIDGFKLMTQKEATPINNAFVSVDSFFFLSGVLVCLVFFRDIAKKGSFDVPIAFIHRYLRLTPPFAVLMLISATLVSRFGNGPFWNENMRRVEDSCRTAWWSGILYIQNFISANTMCLGQSWYLSADMQMFWVSPLILYPLLFFPALAPFFLTLLILGAAFIDFAIVYVNDFSPRMNFQDGSSNDQFPAEYAPFYTRMAPWLIGLFTGYIICGIQAKKIRFKLSLFWTLCGWIVSLALLGASIFSINRFVDYDYTPLESAFYLAFHRVGWGLGLSWIVLACVSGHGGPINYFLSLDIFQPLVKLSYCNFLVHMTLQLTRLAHSRINLYIGHFEIVYYYLGDLLLSYLISIPLCLLFELPFTSIDRHFFQKLSIFPFPAPKEKTDAVDKVEEKPEKEPVEDSMEKGVDNPNFKES